MEGAEIRLFYYDETGAEVEITAANAPVYTDTNGAFMFTVNGTPLMWIATPLIVRTEGGTMYGAAAPTLETVIDDPIVLTYDQVNISCRLSAVSSVAAGLVRRYAIDTGVSDTLMESPTTPGVDTPASFVPFGAVVLDGIAPSGPSVLQFMALSSDRKYIEDDRNDSAIITAGIMDAAGMHTARLEDVDLGVVSGPGNLISNGISYGSGEVSGILTSAATGESLLQAMCPLLNGNDITLHITIPAVDLVTDTDGDGFSDGDEMLGWDIAIDTLGYGSDAGGSLLIVRHVSSDPDMEDTDADGLDDLAEMTAGTDPSLTDTDRDGLEDGCDPHPLYPARVLHVKEGGSTVENGLSWLTAMGSLTDALLQAKAGNATPLIAEDDVAEVWVAAGRFVPSDTGDRTVSFELSPNISVFGGFSGSETKLAQRADNPLAFVTTLSGDLLNNDAESYNDDPASFDDNSLHVIQAGDSVSANTVLDGFYIIGGNADDTSSDEGAYGGGLLSSGTPTLKNLFFRTNIANTGGGVYTAPSMSDGREMNVTNCLFVRNIAIYSGTAEGGAGGGMHFSGPGATLDLDNCECSENRSWGSAGLQLGPDLTANINQCVFDRNDAQQWIVPYQQGIGGGAGIGDGSEVRFDLCRLMKTMEVVVRSTRAEGRTGL